MSNERDQEKLLAQWLTGELSDQDKEQLEQEGGLDELRFALDDVDNWRLPEMNTFKGLADVKERIAEQAPSTLRRQVFFQPWMRYAAAIVLIAAAVFVFRNMTATGPLTLSTGIGESLSHALPDGSTVNIDAVSSIAYQSKNWEDDREVNLEGRALFTVRSGSDFEVVSKSGLVKVLGTVFEVNDRGTTFGVRCFEGKVSVETEGQKEILTPGQGLIVTKTGLQRIEFNDEAPGWIENQLYYNNTSLSAIFSDLERYYDVQFDIDAAKGERRYTGLIPSNNLESVLQLLSLPMNMTYTRNGDTIVFE